MPAIQEKIGQRIRTHREARGWTQEGLAEKCGLHPTYIGGIERGERNPTIESLESIATGFGISLSELLRFENHTLEDKFNSPCEDIMEAILHGFRAQVDVKGKLAELYMAKYLRGLKDEGLIEDFQWNDADNVPDFIIKYKGNKYVVECKNLRSGDEGIYKKESAYKVEVQRTRNSKDGSNTRSYRVGHFDILGVSMFNQTGKWNFFFIASKYLQKADDPQFLKIFQPVPFNPMRPWERDITVVLEDIFGEPEVESKK
jgi:XRE family transcriptional regulator, regulator of sulfur utilization